MKKCEHKNFRVKGMTSRCDNKEDWYGYCDDCKKEVTLRGVNIVGMKSEEPVGSVVLADLSYTRIEE